MRRHWKTLAVVAVVAAIALSVVAVAMGATDPQPTARAAATCGVLMNDPPAAKAMQDLRVEHQRDMQAWFDTYEADPSSAEAQAALQKLREEHWSDMKALADKLGLAAPQSPGGSRGTAGVGCGGACGAGGQGAGYGISGSGGGMMDGGWSY